MQNTNDYRIVLTTFSSVDEAASVVRRLVEEGIIACGNIVPNIYSIYSWKGQIEESQEVLVLLKTSASNIDQCEGRIRELHSYETPEIVTVNISEIQEQYRAWIDSVVMRAR